MSRPSRMLLTVALSEDKVVLPVLLEQLWLPHFAALALGANVLSRLHLPPSLIHTVWSLENNAPQISNGMLWERYAAEFEQRYVLNKMRMHCLDWQSQSGRAHVCGGRWGWAGVDLVRNVRVGLASLPAQSYPHGPPQPFNHSQGKPLLQTAQPCLCRTQQM